MLESLALIGRPAADLPTPALTVDLDALEHNIRRMADLARSAGVALRPHIKTHKTPAIAQLQRQAGAAGIACATLGEADAMIEAGLDDILITRAVIGPGKAAHAAALARRATLRIALDAAPAADELGRAAQAAGVTLGVLIEVNVGQNRCGLDPQDAPALVTLARRIAATPGLRFDGLQAYEGHAAFDPSEATLAPIHAAAHAARRALEAAGIPPVIVSGAATGTAAQTAASGAYTEIQPGSYATMDARYSGVVGEHFRPALGLLATVVSAPTPDRIVLDAGQKALSIDYGAAQVKGRGSDLAVLSNKASDEHAVIEVRAGRRPDVGEVLELYPSHGCTTFNLHDRVFGLRGGLVEAVWPVMRGRSW
ncbi:MAG TPA: alanine racemase [Bacillota bacterium]|nr:alanine racemase [Bacillota bacterium]